MLFTLPGTAGFYKFYFIISQNEAAAGTIYQATPALMNLYSNEFSKACVESAVGEINSIN
jgi:hypothetical protein